MWARLKCTCGYDWWKESVSGAPRRNSPEICPQCGALVDTVTASGIGPDSPDAETIHVGSPPAHDTTAFDNSTPVAGYEVHGELGRGGMGLVLRAYSARLDRFVALKVVQRIDPTTLQRFKQEFRIAADVSHPNLVTLYELVSDGATWFIAMELVEGPDFLAYVSSPEKSHEAPNGADEAPHSLPLLKLIRIRRGLAQLAAAVVALHRAGVLHRDIKPSNVVVTAEERLVLLDFGLAAEMEQAGTYLSTEAGVVGTVGYMSPEQAASKPVTQASDWYSVGVMLYQALTGTLPFSGKPLDVLQQKQRSEPPPPSAVARGVPADLEQLCVDLLRLDPAERPSGERILQRLNVDLSGALAVASQPDVAGDSVVLVGRDQHLAVLDSCYGDMERGQATVLLVHGNSGMGKTALVRAFLEDVRKRHSAVVLAGRCYEQESVPFKALDSLIDSLSHYLRHAPRSEAEGLMPRDIQALTRVFPVLGRVEAVYSAARRTLRIADQQELRRRAVAALREMLARLGDRHPLVLFIDDLQWGDIDSASMLCELIKPPEAPLLMCVGAYRAEDADTSPFLGAFRAARGQSLQQLDCRDLTVGPLKRSECRQLARRLIAREDQVARRQAEIVARESGGSPLLARELARFLNADNGPEAARTIDLENMIVARVAALPHDARRLVEMVAIAGKPMPQRELLHAAGLEKTGHSLLTQLKTEHLIRTASVGDETDVETYHDRIREALLAQSTDECRKANHQLLAQTIEATLGVSAAQLTGTSRGLIGRERSAADEDMADCDWQRIFDLAFHLDASGEYERALPYALAAAEQACAQNSLQMAQQQFEIAQRGTPWADKFTQFRIAEGLGDVLMLRGRYEEASHQFQQALPLAEDDFSRAQIEGKLGELAFKQGDMRTSTAALERALRSLGKAMPRSSLGFFVVALREGMKQILHTLFPRVFLGRRKLQDADRELLAARLFGRVGHAYWFKRGAIATLAAHLSGLNLAEKFPPTPELAQCYSEHAPGMSLLGLCDRGMRYALKSLKIRQESGDLWGQAQSLHFYGIAAYTASRYADCVEKCREATRLFDQTGDYWELNMARYQLAASLYRMGNLQDAQAEARKMHRSGLDLGDVQASGLSVDILSKAACGRAPQAVIRAELDRPRGDDAQTASQVLQAEGVRLLAEGACREAAHAFEQGFMVARQAGVTNTYMIPCLPWLATALRREMEQLPSGDSAEQRRLRRRAEQAARRGVRLARKFQNDLPHALREQGLLASHAGRFPRARRCLDESLRVAERQAARYEYAQTLLAMGEMDVARGVPEGRERVAQAQRLLLEITRPATG